MNILIWRLYICWLLKGQDWISEKNSTAVMCVVRHITIRDSQSYCVTPYFKQSRFDRSCAFNCYKCLYVYDSHLQNKVYTGHGSTDRRPSSLSECWLVSVPSCVVPSSQTLWSRSGHRLAIPVLLGSSITWTTSSLTASSLSRSLSLLW